MKEEESYKVYGKKGGRLKADMSALLHRNFEDTLRGTGWKGLQMFDKAHTVMLTEEGIIPKEIGITILRALRQMEREGVQDVRDKLGGYLHCGEAYITKELGLDIGGWIHCGRSSGDLQQVAIRVDTRDAVIAILKELINIRETLLKKAEEHIDTVMPGYTHLQPAQPITFAFYLLSWVHQFERDFERFQGAYRHINISPAGCAVLTTTNFPINRGRTQELLGFDDIYTNARDAIWSMDHMVETLGALMSTAGILSRLASDLSIWHAPEFGLVEVPDTFCGTSSIMPQKKNAIGLECIRGLNADIIGSVMSYLAATKCPSDSCEMEIMAPKSVYNATEKCIAALQIMNDVVKDLKVNKDVMEKRAGMFWVQATNIANSIVIEKKIPFRLAHEIVGVLVRLACDEGIAARDITPDMLDQAAQEAGAEPLHLSEGTLRKALDPADIVKSKKPIGGTAPERVKEDIASSLKRIEADEEMVKPMEIRLTTAERKLEEAIDKIIGTE